MEKVLKKAHSFTENSGILFGVLAVLVLAVPAWYLGDRFPLIGGPVFAILFGLILSGLKKPQVCVSGITFCSKKLLQYSIIFLGFGMNMQAVLAVGKQSIVVMLCTIAASLITAMLLGKVMKVPGNARILIGVGTSICGGSAIAATAPVIAAEDGEVAQAISTIFLYTIVAALLFPTLGHLMGLSDTGFGMFAGAAINDTSSVVAAGYAFSDAAGEYATIVKLTRTLMIIPITLFLAIYRTHKAKKTGANVGNYSMKKIFPWFVLGFLAAAIINSVGMLTPAGSAFLNKVGKFGIIMAMAAIGLNTDVRGLIKGGIKPILLGLCCWIAVSGAALGVQFALGIV